MTYTIPKLISLDSLNLTYKEASGAACGAGTNPVGGVCTNGTSAGGTCFTGTGGVG